MKKIYSYIKKYCITLLFITLSLNSIYAQGKYMPYDYYPEEYKSLNAEDWEAMKQILDGFLVYENAEQIRELEKPHEARYVLTRMAFIDWGSKQNEIISYLNTFLETLIQGRSFIPNISGMEINREISKYDPVFLPNRVIWTIFFIDENAGCQLVNELWTSTLHAESNEYINNMRFFTLWTLGRKPLSEEVNLCLKEIKKIATEELSPKELEQIEQISNKYELSKIKKQSKAWQYLLDKYEVKTSEKFLTTKNHGVWYDNILYMKEVFGELDINILLDMREKTSDISKQYVLLFSSCFLINTSLSLSPDKETIDLAEKEKKLIDEFYKDNLKEQNPGAGNHDFLKTAYEAMNALLNQE